LQQQATQSTCIMSLFYIWKLIMWKKALAEQVEQFPACFKVSVSFVQWRFSASVTESSLADNPIICDLRRLRQERTCSSRGPALAGRQL
jgi:hypothetical protein